MGYAVGIGLVGPTKFYEVRFRPRVRHVGATAQPRPPAAGAEGDGVLHVPWSSGLRRFWGTRFGGSHEIHSGPNIVCVCVCVFGALT